MAWNAWQEAEEEAAAWRFRVHQLGSAEKEKDRELDAKADELASLKASLTQLSQQANRHTAYSL